MSVAFFQHAFALSPQRRGCHLVTNAIVSRIGDDLSKVQQETHASGLWKGLEI
jgi:hypothetical protein